MAWPARRSVEEGPACLGWLRRPPKRTGRISHRVVPRQVGPDGSGAAALRGGATRRRGSSRHLFGDVATLVTLARSDAEARDAGRPWHSVLRCKCRSPNTKRRSSHGNRRSLHPQAPPGPSGARLPFRPRAPLSWQHLYQIPTPSATRRAAFAVIAVDTQQHLGYASLRGLPLLHLVGVSLPEIPSRTHPASAPFGRRFSPERTQNRFRCRPRGLRGVMRKPDIQWFDSGETR